MMSILDLYFGLVVSLDDLRGEVLEAHGRLERRAHGVKIRLQCHRLREGENIALGVASQSSLYLITIGPKCEQPNHGGRQHMWHVEKTNKAGFLPDGEVWARKHARSATCARAYTPCWRVWIAAHTKEEVNRAHCFCPSLALALPKSRTAANSVCAEGLSLHKSAPSTQSCRRATKSAAQSPIPRYRVLISDARLPLPPQ